jgi:FkbM family methyltransferase
MHLMLLKRNKQYSSDYQFIADAVSGNDTIVDAGANEGLYTVLFSKMCKNVIAIEPNPFLATSIKKMGLKNVEVLALALSDKPGSALLHIPHTKKMPLYGWATIYKESLPECDRIETIRVPTKPLDDIVNTKVDLVKIDVEGAEELVIKGCKELIKRYYPNFLIEVKIKNRKNVSNIMRSYGYKAKVITENGPRETIELSDYPGDDENVFFYP